MITLRNTSPELVTKKLKNNINTMKKTFANFLLLTSGISIGATAVMLGLFHFIGNYTYLVLVTIVFISIISIFLKKY